MFNPALLYTKFHNSSFLYKKAVIIDNKFFRYCVGLFFPDDRKGRCADFI